jgi:hypothetical protein
MLAASGTAEHVEFVIEVSFYGRPPGWWITAG